MITPFQSLSTVAATSLLSAVTHTVSEAIGGRLGLSRKSPAMETSFGGIVRGIRLAGAAILTEPAIATARKTTCTATSYGR